MLVLCSAGLDRRRVVLEMKVIRVFKGFGDEFDGSRILGFRGFVL